MDPPLGESDKEMQDGSNLQGPVNTNADDSTHNTTAEDILNNNNSNAANKVKSSTCKPVAACRPEVELPAHRINARIQFMQDRALIGKFMGLWPTERALRLWINRTWQPKGEITLLIGPKGFFTAIFNCLEDRNRVFEGGPYFFNSAGLFLREWKARFNPDTEDLSYAPVWIRFYSLPWEYWGEESLKDLGSALGDFVKVAEETKAKRYTTYASYARICVYMDLKQPLPDTIRLFHEDRDWIQVIDYENVPFRCRRCHTLGHLFRDCPLNITTEAPSKPDAQTQDGFTKVTNRRRGHKKTPTAQKGKTETAKKSQPSTSNSFETLAQEDQLDIPGSDSKTANTNKPEALMKNQESGKAKSNKPETLLKNQEGGKEQVDTETWTNPDMEIDNPFHIKNKGKEAESHTQEVQLMDDDSESIDVGELDLLGLEQACKSGNFDKIPETQVDNLVEILKKAQKKYSLGIQTGSQWDGKFIYKDSKKRGRKTVLERTIKIGEVLVDSGRYAKLTKYFNTNPKVSQ